MKKKSLFTLLYLNLSQLYFDKERNLFCINFLIGVRTDNMFRNTFDNLVEVVFQYNIRENYILYKCILIRMDKLQYYTSDVQ